MRGNFIVSERTSGLWQFFSNFNIGVGLDFVPILIFLGQTFVVLELEMFLDSLSLLDVALKGSGE